MICPKCKNGIMKSVKRKNYPFGRKSKARVSNWKKCMTCGYEEQE